jgi:phosphatidyl-myo-inositol alpha-mannosyltransferase
MELRIRRDGETARILKRLADQPAAAISKSRTAAPRRGSIPRAVKVGIVVPYSWSYWGAVPEHAELKAEALQKLGVETRTIIGHDPPGSFTRVLHPRHGRHGKPPADVIPIGRSVIVPANGALPNIILSPAAIPRIKRVLQRERFDVVHLHEPMTPVVCTAVLAWARCPVVATFHASGGLGWLHAGRPAWGFLMERIDQRIAVSDAARESAARWFPGDYELIPNGVLIPEGAEAGGRENRIVFIGRHDPRKGMPVLLRAWPKIHRHTGARLRLIGADPLMVRLALTRAGVSEDGIDALGFLSQEALTDELLSAKALVAPSLGGESFGMVLTRAFACATPVVASDITGYRDVMTDETGLLVPPDDSDALAGGLSNLLGDESRRRQLGESARRLAQERYSWDDIARRLSAIYEELT